MVAIAILVVALAFGLTEAHFKCNRDISNSTHKNTILDLKKLLSLESLCMDVCQQSNCSVLDTAGGLLGSLLGGSGGGPLGAVGNVLGGGGPLGSIGSGLLRRRRCANGECSSSPSGSETTVAATQPSVTEGGNGGVTDGGNGGVTDGVTGGGNGGESSGSPCSGGNGPCSQGGSGGNGGALDGVLGAASCLLPGGANPNNISPYQACIIPCILDLNVLDICDVQAIISKILQICPHADLKGVCVSACLCCDKDGKEPIDTCVNLCLSSNGIDLNLSPLKVLGLGGEDGIKAPVIDGFELPGLPLLPNLGLNSGASAGGSVDGGSASASGSGTGSANAGGSNGEAHDEPSDGATTPCATDATGATDATEATAATDATAAA